MPRHRSRAARLMDALLGRHLDERIEAARGDVETAQARLDEAEHQARVARAHTSQNQFSRLIFDSLGLAHPPPRHDSH